MRNFLLFHTFVLRPGSYRGACPKARIAVFALSAVFEPGGKVPEEFSIIICNNIKAVGKTVSL